MENIWLDTALLAIPNYAVSEKSARDLFDRVTHYADLTRSRSSLQVFVSNHAEEDLWTNNCGPDLPEIEFFLELMNLTHVYSAKDLLMSYQTVLARAKRDSSNTAIEVRTLQYFHCDPAIPADYGPAALVQLTKQSFATVVGLLKVSEQWNLGSAIGATSIQVFNVRVVVEAATGRGVDQIGHLPLGLINDVRSLRKCGDLVSTAQASRIWAFATSPDDLALAIALHAISLRKQLDAAATVDDIRPFRLGTDFFDSLRRHQCFGTERYGSVTLQRCAHLAARTANFPIAPFGRPNQLQRKRDGALAYRVHLTGGGVGLRLMFWDLNGCVEFANVGPKHELTIENGATLAISPGDLSVFIQ